MRDSVVVEVCALLVNDRVAVNDPVAVGLNVTVKGTFWPAATVRGRDRPFTLNAALFVLAAVMVTLDPLALRVPDPLPLLPTTMLPIFSVDGVIESCPTGAGVLLPVPLTGIFKDELLVVLPLMMTFPLVDELAVGANVTFTPIFCPAVRTIGSVTPET